MSEIERGFDMKYAVTVGGLNPVAVKESMDDALDVIRAMEEFDRAEGFPHTDYYKVKLIKEGRQ